MFKCPRCINEYSSYNALSKHTRTAYKLKGESLYREYHGIVDIATCKCGCGTTTKWRSDTGYNDYVAGHGSKGSNNSMFGKKHTTEARNSISTKRKEKFASGEYTFINPEETSRRSKQMWATEGFKDHMKSAREASGWRDKLSIAHSGEKNHWYGKKRPEHSALMKTPEMLEKVFAKRSMTDIEQRMASILESLNLKYRNQFFISQGGNTCSYDFKLKGCPILIEVDGDYWHGGPGVDIHVPFLTEVIDKDNIKTQLAEQRGFTLLRFWGSDILNSPQQVIDTLQEQINKTPQ